MTKREKELVKENKDLKKELRRWRDHKLARSRHDKDCQCDLCD